MRECGVKYKIHLRPLSNTLRIRSYSIGINFRMTRDVNEFLGSTVYMVKIDIGGCAHGKSSEEEKVRR